MSTIELAPSGWKETFNRMHAPLHTGRSRSRTEVQSANISDILPPEVSSLANLFATIFYCSFIGFIKDSRMIRSYSGVLLSGFKTFQIINERLY
jgi:hypothetical protein